jgi:VWFA-related protein
MRIRFLEPSLILAMTLPFASVAVEPPPPVRSGLVEKVEVNLVIVDVQVLDRKGNPVSGLTAGDFDVSVDRHPMPIASFDAACAELSEKPDIVLAFDYQHLGETQRTRALDSAQRALEKRGIRDAEIMVAALTGGLRVEHRFTTEGDRVVDALRKMRSDPTLYAGNFGHISEKGFVRGLTALFDVAATVPRPKAILLYSAMQDVPLEEQFQQLSALASASRSVVYPVDMRGLDDQGISGAREVVLPVHG